MEKVVFTDQDFKYGFTEPSKLSVYFPEYRKKYIEQTSKYIIKALEKKNLSCNINLEERFIEVCTNSKTRDPFIFVKGCEFIKLICKNIEVEIGMKVLNDNYIGEIINLRKYASSDKVLERRKNRLIGKNSMVLKALKMVSKSHVVITGKNLGVVGSYDGVSIVKEIAINCIRHNKHPVYEIKKYIVKSKLEEDENMKNEDWSSHIPVYKKKNQKKRKKRIAEQRNKENKADDSVEYSKEESEEYSKDEIIEHDE